jgi:hypothetical protein
LAAEEHAARAAGQFVFMFNKNMDFLAGEMSRFLPSFSSRKRRSASYPMPPSRPLALLEINFKRIRIKKRAEILPQVLSKNADITIREIATRGSL